VSSELQLSFAQEQLSFNITRGNAPGRYLVDLVAKVSTSSANQISLKIDGTLYTGLTPAINVAPSDIYSIQSCDSQGNVVNPIPTQSVDSSFQTYFIARDSFKNKVTLTNQSILLF